MNNIKEAEKGINSEKTSNKIQIIREILNVDLSPIHMILRHGLDDENTALELESAFIDFKELGTLDNEVAGINADHGINVAEILQQNYSKKVFTENKNTSKFMIIKIRQDKIDERITMQNIR